MDAYYSSVAESEPLKQNATTSHGKKFAEQPKRAKWVDAIFEFVKPTNIDFGRRRYRTLFNNDQLLVVLTQLPAGALAPLDIAGSKGLLIVTEGSATYSLGARQLVIGPGDVLDLPLQGRLEARTLMDFLYFSECERNAYNHLIAAPFAVAS